MQFNRREQKDDTFIHIQHYQYYPLGDYRIFHINISNNRNFNNQFNNRYSK